MPSRAVINNLKNTSRSDPGGVDVLAHVIKICKDSFGTQEAFVRSVEATPEPLCILATDQQLTDMERFIGN